VKDQAKATAKLERMRRQLAPRKPAQDAKPDQDTKPLQAERFLTVALAPDATPSTPWLRLRGKWLAQAGFPQSTRVRVQVELGKLIITPEEAAA
jgi:toxic protein SymE